MFNEICIYIYIYNKWEKNTIVSEQMDKIKNLDVGKWRTIKTKIIIYVTFPCSAVTSSFDNFFKNKNTIIRLKFFANNKS